VSVADQLARFKRVHPRMRRLGTLHDPDRSAAFVERARAAARAQGLVLVSREARDPQTAAAALTRLSGEVDAVWLPADPRLVTGALFRYARDLTLKRGIALFGFLEGFTAAGALASVSPDVGQIGEQAARLALGLLARPPEARLPVPPAAFARGSLSIHAGSASLLGIELDDEALADAARLFR
jgi:putative ABC transport system substrate-binding protein